MNIKARPDDTGYAPKNEAWHAFDDDSYDGAEDAGRQYVGYGPTPEKAIEDLLEQMQDEGHITERERRRVMREVCNLDPGIFRFGVRQ